MKLGKYLFILIIFLFITGCNNGEKYTVTFDSDGGSSVKAIVVKDGKTIEIEEPTKVGYDFVGWYTDLSNSESIISDSTVITDNLTLYAKWSVSNYTINFISNGGSIVESVNADYNEIIAIPTTPVRSDFEFVGWYKDSEFTKPYNFESRIIEDLTLYAKWRFPYVNIIENIELSRTSIIFDLDLVKLNINIESMVINIYNKDVLINTITDGYELTYSNDVSFTGLSENEDYLIKVLANYELNDVEYTSQEVFEYSFSTNLDEINYIYINQVFDKFDEQYNYVETTTMNSSSDYRNIRTILKYEIDMQSNSTGLIKVQQTSYSYMNRLYQYLYIYDIKDRTNIYSYRYDQNKWYYHTKSNNQESQPNFDFSYNFEKETTNSEYIFKTGFDTVDDAVNCYKNYEYLICDAGIPKAAIIEYYDLIDISLVVDKNTDTLKQIKFDFKDLAKSYFSDNETCIFDYCDITIEYTNYNKVNITVPTGASYLPANQVPSNLGDLEVIGNHERLDIDVSDSVIDYTTNIIYFIDRPTKSVYSINYLTNEQKIIELDYDPVAIYLHEGFLYVAMQDSVPSYDANKVQSGVITKIRCSSFELGYTFNVTVDPYDLVVTNDDIIVVTSASSQHTYSHTYSMEGTRLGLFYTYMETKIEYSSVLNRVYSMETSVYPKDLDSIHFDSLGKVVLRYDSRYHGDYNMSTVYAISPDGNHIYNGSGAVFSASLTKTEDIIFETSIPYSFSSIAFDLDNDRYFIASGDVIIMMRYSTNKPISVFYTAMTTNWIYYEDDKIISIEKDVFNNYNISQYDITD